ncbi:CBS domain-containing protein [Roseomonas marmotae]|uniref:CBS domain-containing protein n=1 Tax=Roseomonas marmotae TaxID=2768161 RepID=A0ABS3KA38_9PROT|nr:CBS domain-containing protein [Roseomonas marmotae]MBO1074314.1 CBS domain-containing protein [Roseomonas marmotae]QTI78067.1 CBS domain-containing protein [Roseomonas marmotae]
MRVNDIMTKTLVTIPPEAPVSAIAAVFADRGISGAPVVDPDGKLLGMVTEGDLTRGLAATEDKPQSWLWGLFSSRTRQAEHYARTHGRRAQDIMTTSVATVSEDDTVEHVASILEKRHIRRVPVVRDGKLQGVVSRADLIRALLSSPEQIAADVPDTEIRRQVRAAMRDQPWADIHLTFVNVVDGVVTFHGFCRSEEVKRALRVLALKVPGVKEVRFDVAPTPRFMLGG